MAEAAEERLGAPALRGAGRHRIAPREAAWDVARARGGPSRSRRARPCRGPGSRSAGRRPRSRRRAPRAAVGRRLGPAARAEHRAPPRRQGPHDVPPAPRRGHDPGAEHRAQAPLAAQGRRAGAAGGARPASLPWSCPTSWATICRRSARGRRCRIRRRSPTPWASSRGAGSSRKRLSRYAFTCEAGARGQRPETAKAGDAAFHRTTTQIIGGNRQSVLAGGARGVAARPAAGGLDHAPRGRGPRGGALSRRDPARECRTRDEGPTAGLPPGRRRDHGDGHR